MQGLGSHTIGVVGRRQVGPKNPVRQSQLNEPSTSLLQMPPFSQGWVSQGIGSAVVVMVVGVVVEAEVVGAGVVIVVLDVTGDSQLIPS